MIDVRALANKSTQQVNPNIPAVIYHFSGYEYPSKGIKKPKYEQINVRVQRQQLTQTDIQYLANIEQQGYVQTVYVYGDWKGVNRINGTSADIFVFDGEEWKVIHVPERWPTWCRVILCQQESLLTD